MSLRSWLLLGEKKSNFVQSVHRQIGSYWKIMEEIRKRGMPGVVWCEWLACGVSGDLGISVGPPGPTSHTDSRLVTRNTVTLGIRTLGTRQCLVGTLGTLGTLGTGTN